MSGVPSPLGVGRQLKPTAAAAANSKAKGWQLVLALALALPPTLFASRAAFGYKILFLSCSLIGKTPFFGNGLYQFESGQLS